jgi:LPXTG-motif cell wall-anchored protein
MIFLALLPLLGHAEISAQAQGSEPLVRSNIVMLIQGETDAVNGTEAKNDFYALKIVSYELPRDSSRVYTNIPQDAREVNVWTQLGSVNQPQSGRETSGNMSGKFFIDVPASHLRNSKFTNATANESAFRAPGSTFENVKYSSEALQLSEGFESGSFVSADIPVSAAFNIISGNLTLSGNSSDNVTSYLSNDGGVTWTQCENNTEFNFTATGTVLKARFVLDGNITLGILPNITSFKVVADFVQLKTVFTVHVSYLWTMDFTDRLATIDLSEAMPYTSSGSFLVMLYTLKGYKPQGVGFNLTLDEAGSMNSYPDKDLYLYSTSSPPSGGNLSLALTAPKADYSWVLYVAAGAALVTLLGFVLLKRRRRARGKLSSVEDEEVEEELPEVDREARRKELVERKKKILAEMEGLKDKGSSEELKNLKNELKQVRNELNKLPKAGEITAARVEKLDTEALSQEPYEAVLGSIARLDDDFDKGRLPEATYRSLRKEYVAKAAVLMALGKKAQDKAESPLVAEKNKLMEAILALDDEREKGEIGEKVYKELRASYRKELAEVTRKLDARTEGE